MNDINRKYPLNEIEGSFPERWDHPRDSDPPPPYLVKALHDWLGEEGRRFFRAIKFAKGGLNVVLRSKGLIPVYPVHLREGMQVRNFLRTQPVCENWTAHDFDNQWARLTELAMKEK